MATHTRHAAALARVEARGVERHAVTITGATVREHGQHADGATLIDLSIYGCRLATDTPPPAGARLWLRFNGGWPIAATVVWANGEHLGCRFDKPIPNALMRELTRG